LLDEAGSGRDSEKLVKVAQRKGRSGARSGTGTMTRARGTYRNTDERDRRREAMPLDDREVCDW
jgi:hypothetical protein